jgi:hypothetical protein
MNLKAFVYGLLSGPEGELPREDAISFTETLAILMDAGIERPYDRDKFRNQLSALIGRIELDTTEGSGEIADKLRRIFKDFDPTLAPAHVPVSAPADVHTCTLTLALALTLAHAHAHAHACTGTRTQLD